jgi:hypothetical protein
VTTVTLKSYSPLLMLERCTSKYYPLNKDGTMPTRNLLSCCLVLVVSASLLAALGCGGSTASAQTDPNSTMPSVQMITTNATLTFNNGGNNPEARAQCPSGTTMLAGGGTQEGGIASVINGSFPCGGNTWCVNWAPATNMNGTTYSIPVSTYAICASGVMAGNGY